jgi:hypothetical protein
VEAGVVNALQQECGQTAAEHGFSRDWEDAAFLEKLAEKMSGYQMWEITGDVDGKDTGSVEDYLVEMAGRYRNNVLGTKLMLIVSELSEGLESLRHNGGAEGALDGQGNFGEELADAIVRILDTGTFVKANLGDELLSKMAVNKDRDARQQVHVMKYIAFTYRSGTQMLLESLGPETVIGMVSDVVRGNYTGNDGDPVTKIEIGDVMEREKWKVA